MIADPFDLLAGRADLPAGVLLAVGENFPPDVRADLLADLLAEWVKGGIRSVAGAAVARDLAADRRALWRSTAARLRGVKKVSLAGDAPCARAVRADLEAAVKRGEIKAEMLASERTIRREIAAAK